MDSEGIKLIDDHGISKIMEERGITETDIREVIFTAEDTGVKLCKAENQAHCLAKKRLGKFTVYVEYEAESDGYKLIDIYSHRVSLSEDLK